MKGRGLKLYQSTLAIFLLSLVAPLRAEMPFTKIKGLYDAVDEQYAHLAPMHGFAWWRSRVVENLYRYGDTDDATIKMLHELFYLNPGDDITFDVTHLKRKPAAHLTPQTVGKILYTMETVKEASLREALLQVIKDDIGFAQLQQQAAQAVREKEGASPLFKAFLRRKKLNKERLSLLEQRKRAKGKPDEIKRIDAQLKQIDAQRAQAQEALKGVDKARLKEEVQRIARDIHSIALTEEGLRQLVDSIVGSLQESGAKFPPHTTHMLLLAFLWKLSETKQDFLNYLLALHDAGLQVFADPALATSQEQQEAWLAAGYTTKDIDEAPMVFKEKFADVAATLSNFDEALFYQYAAHVRSQDRPLMVQSIGDAEYQSHKFADCGATSLRNFFNILLWDKNTNALKPQYLMQSGLKLNEKLKDFYARHNSVETIMSDQLHHEWATVVSDLPGVQYRKPPGSPVCEIDAGLRNMLAVMAHLLFKGDVGFAKLSVKEKLDLICTKLSREGFELEWEADGDVNLEEKDKAIVLEFEINEEAAFKWEFKPGHFDIALESELKEQEHLRTTMPNIGKKSLTDTLKITSTLVLAYEKPLSFESQLTQAPDRYLFFFSMPFWDHAIKIRTMGYIYNSALVAEPRYKKLMLALGRKIPKDMELLATVLFIFVGTNENPKNIAPYKGYLNSLLAKVDYHDWRTLFIDLLETIEEAVPPGPQTKRYPITVPLSFFKFLLGKLPQEGHNYLIEDILYEVIFHLRGLRFEGGSYPYVDLILRHGAEQDPSWKIWGGLLHHPVRTGQKEIVARLLRAGVDPAFKDEQGKTAADYTQDPQMKALLEKYSKLAPAEPQPS